MVQISKLSPFQLKNFDTMIKSCVVFCLVGLLLHFVTEENFQRERSIFFVILYFILIVIVTIGKKWFIIRKHEKLSLWMLYLSMMLATIGFPLLAYSTEASQSFQNFIFNCIIMFSASIIVNVYFIVMRKYGRKFLSERFLIYAVILPILVLLFIPAILLSVGDNFISALVWCGIIGLSMTMVQYQRIGAYFEQKNVKRYGNSLDIANKKKEGGKK